jgi:hypothetical protein
MSYLHTGGVLTDATGLYARSLRTVAYKASGGTTACAFPRRPVRAFRGAATFWPHLSRIAPASSGYSSEVIRGNSRSAGEAPVTLSRQGRGQNQHPEWLRFNTTRSHNLMLLTAAGEEGFNGASRAHTGK